MRPSRYSCFYSVDDSTILGYNTLTTALVSLSQEEFAAIEALYAEPSDDTFRDLNLPDLQSGLREAGLIVPDGLDERAQVAAIHAASRGSDHHLAITIIPTLDCNFRCAYCFSYARRGRMSAEVQDALFRFVEARLSETDGLSISWYGGEPTLCMAIIERVAGRLHELGARRNVKAKGDSIITNGYRLTRPVAERLRASGVTRAQVTLDGDRPTHDARRPLVGGRPTFDRIVHNLAEVHDVLDVSVRINVDRANAETAVLALDALVEAGLHGKVQPYFGHVKPFSEACGDIAGACLNDREFSELNLALSKQALVRGFGGFPYPRSLLAGACGAGNPRSHVVAPDGFLFKCWAEASRGPEWSVGSLFAVKRTPQQETNLRLYQDWDPLTDPECSECRILPICMGGCPHLRLRHSGLANCANWRYTLGETLGIRYKFRDSFRPRDKANTPAPAAASRGRVPFDKEVFDGDT